MVHNRNLTISNEVYLITIHTCEGFEGKSLKYDKSYENHGQTEK